MSEKIQRFILLMVGVLAMSLAIGYIVFAWVEPTAPPPQGNVPAPINVGSMAQTKTGDLTVKTTFYGDDIRLGNWSGPVTAAGDIDIKNSGGTTVIQLDGDTGNAYFSGNVGIGTTTSAFKLDVDGDIRIAHSGKLNFGPTPEVGGGVNPPTPPPFGIIGKENFQIGLADGFGWLQAYGVGSGVPIVLNPNGGNVGVGTTTPAYKLDVIGTLRTTATTTFAGNVGIGTTIPSYKLDVNGNSRITGNLSIGGNVIMGWERIANSCSSCNSMTLTCSTGKKVLGGGCGILGITTYRLMFSGPIGDDQWQCNTYDVVPTLQGFIICARMQ